METYNLPVWGHAGNNEPLMSQHAATCHKHVAAKHVRCAWSELRCKIPRQISKT